MLLFGGYGARSDKRHVAPYDIKQLRQLVQAGAPEKIHSAITEAAKLKNGEVEIVSIIGTSDFFLEPNRRMHKLLSDNKVAHAYVELRGGDDKSSGHNYSFTTMSYPVIFSFVKNWFEHGKGRIVCGP